MQGWRALRAPAGVRAAGDTGRVASGARDPGSPASWARPGEERDEVLVDDRPRRRLPPWARRVALAAVGLSLVALVAPRLLSEDAAKPAADRSSSPPTSVAPIPSIRPTLPGPLRWATRGDLRDDLALLDSVRAQVTGAELTSVEEVLWAGRVRAGRAVVVAGFDQRTGIDAAYSVPVVGVLLPSAGGPAVVRTLGDLSGNPDSVQSWALPAGQLLLLGPPGPLRVQVSPDVTFTPDGRAHRTWTDVDSADGFALVSVRTTSRSSIGVATELGVDTLTSQDRVVLSELPVAGLGGVAYHGPAATLVRETISEQLPQPPLVGWRLTAGVAWSSTVGEGGVGQAVVVVIRRSDGATFLAGLIEGPGEGPSAFALRTVRWTHPEQAPFVFAEAGGGLGLDGRQVVAIPGGRGTLAYETARGRGTVPIDANGLAVVDAGMFDVDPVSVTITNSLGTRHYDRRELLGDDAQGAGYDNRINGPG